jgi:cell division protein FtsA
LGFSGLAEATAGPGFSTCAGLLRYAVKERLEVPPEAIAAQEASSGRFGRVGQWLRENF